MLFRIIRTSLFNRVLDLGSLGFRYRNSFSLQPKPIQHNKHPPACFVFGTCTLLHQILPASVKISFKFFQIEYKNMRQFPCSLSVTVIFLLSVSLYNKPAVFKWAKLKTAFYLKCRRLLMNCKSMFISVVIPPPRDVNEKTCLVIRSPLKLKIAHNTHWMAVVSSKGRTALLYKLKRGDIKFWWNIAAGALLSLRCFCLTVGRWFCKLMSDRKSVIRTCFNWL